MNEPLGYIPALVSHACCTCKKFDDSRGYLGYESAHDDDGTCLEPKNDRTWTRGYFGCSHHVPDVALVLKLTAETTNVAE